MIVHHVVLVILLFLLPLAAQLLVRVLDRGDLLGLVIRGIDRRRLDKGMLQSMGEWLIMLGGHRRIFISVAEKKKANRVQPRSEI